MGHSIDPAIRENFAAKQIAAKQIAPLLKQRLTAETLEQLISFMGTGCPLRQELQE